ncbi:phosphate ABC transporter substrate-binding protein PstS [Candidatus Pyrohabitans sp.]
MNRLVLVPVIAILLFAGCTGSGGKATAGAEEITINGAGASFPYPLISKWSYEYHKLNPSIKINYQSIGSGGGIKQTMAKTVDFGASDAPLKEKEYAKMEGILHIPETIGAVVVVYNIPGIESGLKLSGDVIADIFLGRITKWNDPRIAELNPGIDLPDKGIIVAHRSDGSGTTFVFSDYLSAVSEDWKEKVGKGKSLNWPLGLGGKGNEGVAGLVKQNPYSIGYVELAYAIENRITYAHIKNREGKFIEPSIDSVAAAATGAVPTLPRGDESWTTVTIVNSPGENAYPISSFTYLLVYRDLAVIPGMTEAKAKALVEFLWWVIHDGQRYAPGLHYATLPEEVVKLNEETIKLITYRGKSLL